ncbi:MAG TPA: Ig-like domain repeat protein [Candidatus Acidoferrales bacterium]|nr:Ig-like domain repeat protein [Candidatus Acidoferrales bacterium]
MTTASKRRPFAVVLGFGTTISVLLAVVGVCAAQQGQPSLQITSPADGTIVSPGQTITVAVSSPENASFAHVVVIGEDPIGFSSMATSAPAQLSVTIPSDINSCRPYALTAVGSTSSGQTGGSDPISIDVERSDMPTSLSAPMPSITFGAIGETLPIQLLANFSDGSTLEVTRSSYVAYSSSNTAVATVDANGIISAVATGSASVTATYALNGQNVQAVIPVTVPEQIMTISPGSLSFGNQNLGTQSATQQLTVTNAADDTLKIVSVAASGDFAESDNCASASPLSPSGTCTITVAFIPTGTGARTGAVTVGNAFSIIPTTISLSGTGIGQPTTSTALASSANPSVFGQAVTLTATVTPSSGSTPTGPVTFSDGSTALSTVSLNSSGAAAFTTSSLSIGSHSITAVYGGDSTFQGSTGTLSQTVNAASTTTTVNSSANPSILNSAVTFAATVSVTAPAAGTPTGTIAFKDGSAVLSTVAINTAGQATLSTSALVTGPHSIAATYSGDSNFNGSLSATLSQSVQYEAVGSACDGDAGHQILQPINADGSSVFKQGQTVPAKFRVCDANGTSIGTAGVVSSFLLTQIVSGTATTNVENIVDTNNPDTAFRWDPTNQQWIFNISTQSLGGNSTYVYTIALNDGTTINFQFGLR